jgi:hypothetical protein
VYLGLAELVQVLEKFDDVRAAARRGSQRRAVVPQLLQERVRLVSAQLLRLRLGQRLDLVVVLLLRRRRRRWRDRATCCGCAWASG